MNETQTNARPVEYGAGRPQQIVSELDPAGFFGSKQMTVQQFQSMRLKGSDRRSQVDLRNAAAVGRALNRLELCDAIGGHQPEIFEPLDEDESLELLVGAAGLVCEARGHGTPEIVGDHDKWNYSRPG